MQFVGWRQYQQRRPMCKYRFKRKMKPTVLGFPDKRCLKKSLPAAPKRRARPTKVPPIPLGAIRLNFDGRPDKRYKAFPRRPDRRKLSTSVEPKQLAAPVVPKIVLTRHGKVDKRFKALV